MLLHAAKTMPHRPRLPQGVGEGLRDGGLSHLGFQLLPAVDDAGAHGQVVAGNEDQGFALRQAEHGVVLPVLRVAKGRPKVGETLFTGKFGQHGAVERRRALG